MSSARAAFRRADGVVLPGVGAFGEAAKRLNRLGLFGILREWVLEGRPFLGICLGLQLLFEESREFGRHRGLNCFRGRVAAFPKGMTVPHMGWNSVDVVKRGWLFKGIPDGSYFYFVHSYFPVPRDRRIVAGRTTYGVKLTCAIEKGAVAAVQFHPEKSQKNGLMILANFAARVAAERRSA